MRGADTTAAHVNKLADQHRIQISEELREPLESNAVTLCPDMWTDPVRQISYLGIAATFVDQQFQFRSYDLSCCPFEEEDKSAESVIAVSIVVSCHLNHSPFLGNAKRIEQIRYHRFICSSICERSRFQLRQSIEEFYFLFLFRASAEQHIGNLFLPKSVN